MLSAARDSAHLLYIVVSGAATLNGLMNDEWSLISLINLEPRGFKALSTRKGKDSASTYQNLNTGESKKKEKERKRFTREKKMLGASSFGG